MEAYLKLNKKDGDGGVVVQLKQRSAQSQVIVLLEKKKMKEAYELFKQQAQVISYVPPQAPSPAGAWINLHEDHC